MIKAVFDAATLADAVSKASRVAPVKGSAYDKAAGVLLEVQPAKLTATLKSTNIDVSYFQRLIMVEAKGDDAVWRIPSAILSGLLSNLPMGTGVTVNFFDRGDGSIRITSGTVKVKLSTLPAQEFPTVTPFDPAYASEANDFAQKVSNVSWACAKDNSIVSGVHVNGTHLVATDRNVLAMVPCVVPVTEPVIVPLALLAPILKAATDVHVKVADDRLQIVLDAESQSQCNIIEGVYPNTAHLHRDNYTGKITVPKTQFVDSINRLLIVARAERMPAVLVTITPGLTPSMVLDLEASDTGRIQDTIDIGGEVLEEFKVGITPGYIIPAIENSKAELVTIEYGHPDTAKAALYPLRISDDTGYEAIVSPRRIGA